MPLRNGHICVLTAIMFLVSAAQAQQQPDPDSRGNNITGSGTTNTIPVWTGTNSIGNSVMFQTGGNLGVGTTTPGSKLDVAGDVNFSGVLRYQGNTVLRFPIGTNNPIGNNTALGVGALQSSSGGIYNTAVGYNALSLNSSEEFNTAIGEGSLSGNTVGVYNVAIGTGALNANTSGNYNVAIGQNAVVGNPSTGSGNVGIGLSPLGGNTTGGGNIAIGSYALNGNTTGGNNIGIGNFAGDANLGNGNVAIGQFAGSSLTLTGSSNNIHIGSPGVSSDNATIRIGTPGTQISFFAAGVSVATVNGVSVLVDPTSGQLGVASSSRRYKEDIRDMADGSNGLMRLRPVTFRYQKPFADGSKPIQYGLIAEEVAEVYPDLVAKGADGQIETVKYQLLDTMLLNEYQKQQKKIDGLEEENDLLRKRLAKLETAMEKMTDASGVQ